MNKGKIIIKFLCLSLLLTMIFSAFAVISVSAEPDETYAVESFVATEDYYTEEETYEDYYTEDETEGYEDYYEDTTGYYEDTEETEAFTDASEAVSESTSVTVAETVTETEPTYRAPLPTVEDSVITPHTVVGAVKDREEPNLFWGFLSWILIGIGVAVIFAVILSTKARAYRGGRDRYSNTDKISGKKKLLPQEYYDKRKRR